MSKKSVLMAASMAALLALIFIPAASADYPDNFDSYANGTVSPGPWTQTTTMAACWTGSEVSTLSPVTGALSQPNVYAFVGASTAGCFTTSHNVQLSASTEPTSTVVTVSFWYNVAGSAGSNSSSYTFSLMICGTLVGTAAVAHSTSYWIHLTYSGSATIGTACAVDFELATVNSGSAHTIDFWIDNVQITGANIITSGANFFLINAQTGALFNIANYSDSYILIEFGTSAPVFYYNVTIPDLNINTAGATLATVWVGQSYFVSIIPAQSGNNYVFLNPPNSPVLQYSLELQDLSGKFTGNGTTATITQGNRTMYSNYWDGANNIALWLIPGTYGITLHNGVNTYTTTAAFPSVAGSTVLIQILKGTTTDQCGQQCTIGYGAGFTPDQAHVLIFFNDTGMGTTYIQDSIYIRNGSGTFLLYQATHTGTFGSFTDDVSCNTKACNIANASMMYVNLNYNGPDGSDSVNVPISGGGIFAQPFSIPPNLLGLDLSFPGVSVNNIFSYFAILAVASVFGVFSARFGVIVTAVVAAALAYAGWLPVSNAGITFLIGMAVLAFVASIERSS